LAAGSDDVISASGKIKGRDARLARRRDVDDLGAFLKRPK